MKRYVISFTMSGSTLCVEYFLNRTSCFHALSASRTPAAAMPRDSQSKSIASHESNTSDYHEGADDDAIHFRVCDHREIEHNFAKLYETNKLAIKKMAFDDAASIFNLRNNLVICKNMKNRVLELCEMYELSYKIMSVSLELVDRLVEHLVQHHLGLHRSGMKSSVRIECHESSNVSVILVNIVFEEYVHCKELWYYLKSLRDHGLRSGCRLLAFVIVYIAFKFHGTAGQFSIQHMLIAQRSCTRETMIIEDHYQTIEAAVLKLLNFKLNVISLDEYFDVQATRLRYRLVANKKMSDLLAAFDYYIEPLAVSSMFDLYFSDRIYLLQQTIEYCHDRSYNAMKDDFELEHIATDQMLVASSLLLALLLHKGLKTLAQEWVELLNPPTRSSYNRFKGLAHAVLRWHRHR